jgi:WD40 repeat protein
MRQWVPIQVLSLLISLTSAHQSVRAGENSALLYSPSGKTLIAANVDGNLRFLDAVTGEEHLKVQAHAGGAFGLALSPQGKVLASTGGDGAVTVQSPSGTWPISTQ